MPLKRAIPALSLILLLLGVAAVSAFSWQSVAQTAVSARNDAAAEQALLPSAPPRRSAVSTRGRRNRAARLLAQAPAPTPAPPAPSIRAVLAQDDIELRHQRIAEEVLRAMPKRCEGTLKNFYVRYDNPSQRGLAGKSSIIVSGNVPDDEFRALLVHEYGHIMDLGCLRGTKQSGASAFRDGSEIIFADDPSVAFYAISWSDSKTRRPESRGADFVSGYAQWDPFEDLSETVTAYVLHREGLLALAEENAAVAAKVAWLRTYLFTEEPAVAESAYAWPTKHPWDMTKLPYAWAAGLRWE